LGAALIADAVEYAIPTRARAETLAAKTLPLLERLGVARERVKLYVHPSEWGTYDAWLVRAFGPKIGRDYELRVGGLGMSAQRHAILDAYPEGVPVVQLDDDLRDLVARRSEKRLEPVEPEEWRELVSLAFARPGPLLWGLYPVPNPYFMRPGARVGLTYVGGGLFGYLNDPSPGSPLRVTLEDKEDFERSLACYSAGWTLLRFGHVSWRTEGYRGAGGMQADGGRTDERIRASAEELVRRFPDLASLNLTKRSGKAEVRLRDARRPRR
jgi:hypothetical protein